MTEMMVAIILSTIVIGGIMAAYVQGLLIAQQESIYNDLHFDLEKSTERIRADLRLSSVGIGMMSFYPTNSSKFTAISLPLSRETNGLVKVDTNGRVVWNQTVVYHVKPGTPDQLMRTIFEPRYSNSADLLYSQLAKVVTATTAAQYAAARLPFGTPTESVSTNVIFSNLVDIEFTCGDTNSTYDCYSATPAEGRNVFGSIVLGPGNHVVDFTVIRKNPASSGYNFGIDNMSLSASRSRREGELFDPNNAHPAAPYYVKSVSGGGAAGGHFEEATTAHPIISNLKLTNAVVGSTLRLNVYNDLWCDSDFEAADAVASNCSVKLDRGFISVAPFIPDTVVSPDMGTAWNASSCGDEQDKPLELVTATVITNTVFGINTNNTLRIDRDGYWARFYFSRPSTYAMAITNARVIDVATGVSSNITFNGGQPGLLVEAGGEATIGSDWVPMWGISRTNTYRVRFEAVSLGSDMDYDLIVGAGDGRLWYFENTGTVSSAGWYGPGAFWFWQGIDVGSYSGPAFGDLDDDGDMDLMVGEYIGDGSDQVQYWANTGSTFSAGMALIDPDWKAVSHDLTRIALVDIDGDGDLDYFSGGRDGKIQFCANTGTVSNPVWANVDPFWNGIQVFRNNSSSETLNYSAPAFVDIDGDKDLDLFVGRYNNPAIGDLIFFQNTGSVTNPIFSNTNRVSPYLQVPGADFTCPEFCDINGDGLQDLFVGTQAGNIACFMNTGTKTNAVWGSTNLTYGGIAVGGNYSVPKFVNLDRRVFGLSQWVNEDGIQLSTTNGISGSRVLGLQSIEVGYARYSTYRSGVFDTLKLDPAYNELNFTWLENTGAGGDVDVRIRSSDSPGMTGASWTDARLADDGYFQGNVGNSLALLPHKRYVQYEALFTCNGTGAYPDAHTNARLPAILRDVTIDWPGSLALIDLNVDFDMGPDGGIVSATVDGETLVKGVGVITEIFRVGRTGTNTVRGSLLVRPLNTRK